MPDDTSSAATRECPFCRETIRADALRCGRCTSWLLPPPPGYAAEPPAPATAPEDKPPKEEVEGAPGHVTYILDKDLIRFVKVAGTFLGLILTVGGVFTGFDLKNLETKTRDSAEKAQQSKKDIDDSMAAVHQEKLEVDQEKAKLDIEVQAIERLIQDSKPEIEKAAAQAHVLLASQPAESTGPAPAPSPTPSPTGALKSFTGNQLARLYNFPANLTGEGQTIGMIELGGGYRTEDLNTYFHALNLPTPEITAVSVDGAANKPTTSNGSDGAVAVNIEAAGAAAPKARQVLYFAPNTDTGFVDAVRTAANDTAHPLSVLLITWGSPETSWTTQGLHSLNDALQQAASHNITVVAAAGDSGPNDGTPAPAVDFPSSSPWVLAVGGTRLEATAGKILGESVWNSLAANSGATGGGRSAVFPRPSWQNPANVPAINGKTGRGTPDLAAAADPATGYRVRVDGETIVIGGTNASASLWAGFIALLNQGLNRRLGYITPTLYSTLGPAGVFNPVTANSKGCAAGAGWNDCTGWGTPNGQKLLDALRKLH